MVDLRELAKDILSQVDIVDIISRYLDTSKRGKDYLAICPFHDDTRPSMHISPERQIFTCFSCGATGNAITFVQKYEKITFFEALKKVAELAGLQDERLKSLEKTKKVDTQLEPLYACIDTLNKFYIYSLKNAQEASIAKEYLEKREISEEQIAKFQLGYSLPDGEKTIKYLQANKFSLKNIEDIGIAYARTEGTSDLNAGRLIFPIHNNNGKVVGFSARRLTENKEEAKFINSPETKIFHKSTVLYNYYNAVLSAKHDGFIYVVEGFMDVFAFDSIGINSVVALMGTAFSKENAQTLRRLNVEVRLCLDGDLPGQMAMMKAMQILDKEKIPFRLVFKDGNIKDPDEILKQDGPEALKEFANSLVDPLDFATAYYMRTGKAGSVEERKKIINYFLPTLVQMDDEFVLDDRIGKLARATGFEVSAIKNLVLSTKNSNKPSNDDVDFSGLPNKPLFKKEKRALQKLTLTEREVLIQMLNSKEAIDFFNENIECFKNDLYQRISDYIVEYNATHNTVDIADIISQLSESEHPQREEMIKIVGQLASDKTHPSYSIQYMEDCAKTIKEEKEKAYKKELLDKLVEGKSEEEKARIFQDYLNRTKK